MMMRTSPRITAYIATRSGFAARRYAVGDCRRVCGLRRRVGLPGDVNGPALCVTREGVDLGDALLLACSRLFFAPKLCLSPTHVGQLGGTLPRAAHVSTPVWAAKMPKLPGDLLAGDGGQEDGDVLRVLALEQPGGHAALAGAADLDRAQHAR